MTMIAPDYGLYRVASSERGDPIVVLHGIRQVWRDLAPFARSIADVVPERPVLVFGYDHTRGLAQSGRLLADALDERFPEGRIDLVGYSMGGLVARLAASETHPSRIHTVITVATPNRGSLSNRELTTLGQMGRSAFEWISQIAPRTEGIKDLTRADDIMSERRQHLLHQYPGIKYTSAQRRYASIPGLFYRNSAPNFDLGPSLVTSGLQAFMLVGLRGRLIRMTRPHDGIVTESSCNVAHTESEDWAELNLIRASPHEPPAKCHAVHDRCSAHDHVSILKDAEIAQLAAALVVSSDWRTLRKDHPELEMRSRLVPFDVD